MKSFVLLGLFLMNMYKQSLCADVKCNNLDIVLKKYQSNQKNVCNSVVPGDDSKQQTVCQIYNKHYENLCLKANKTAFSAEIVKENSTSLDIICETLKLDSENFKIKIHCLAACDSLYGLYALCELATWMANQSLIIDSLNKTQTNKESDKTTTPKLIAPESVPLNQMYVTPLHDNDKEANKDIKLEIKPVNDDRAANEDVTLETLPVKPVIVKEEHVKQTSSTPAAAAAATPPPAAAPILFDSSSNMQEEEQPKLQEDEQLPDYENENIEKPTRTEEDLVETKEDVEDDSYFFQYFMVVCVIFIAGYVGYHNKQKILAMLLEGRREKRHQRRRPNSANYHKLDCNLEEAVTSSCNKNTSSVIY